MARESDPTFVDKLSKQGEEALGRLAEEIVASPLVGKAVSGAFDARDKAVQAQEAALSALNIPSAADIERLTRRLRSVSQRLEGIEDSLDRMEQKLAAASRAAEADGAGDEVSARLGEIAKDLSALRDVVTPEADPPPRGQERLTVSDS